MSVEADLVARLGPLVSGRIFPDVAKFSTPRPYITYQQVGGDAVAYLDDIVPTLQNGLVQINVWAGTRAEANGLARQVESLLVGASAFQARAAAAFRTISEADLEPPLYGTMQDFDIWSTRT